MALKVHKVQPGFNTVGLKEGTDALETPPSLEIFDDRTRKLLDLKAPFALQLGAGFDRPEVAAGFIAAPCAGLASAEQLMFLKKRGLTEIRMGRLHGTLAQNAKAVGVKVVVGKK